MKIIYSNIIPPRKFAAINLLGILFVRKQVILTPELINHEKIHTRQMKEMFFLFFYVWYVLEWIVKLFIYGKKSYFHISFEQEAYTHDENLSYLKIRKRFAWINYLFR
jgi:hypothetical protein